MEWFNQATTEFTDATIYLVMALLGTILFVIRVVMTLVGGIDADMDMDVDVDADVDVDVDGVDHDTGFALISVLSITSFFMGTGWIGLLVSVRTELGSALTALIAVAFGFSLMLLSAWGMYGLRKLQQTGSYNVRNCIGKLGRVYLKVPAKNEGEGQVQLNVDGRHKVLAAVSAGPSIESFATVKVVGVQGDEVLVVEPHSVSTGQQGES